MRSSNSTYINLYTSRFVNDECLLQSQPEGKSIWFNITHDYRLLNMWIQLDRSSVPCSDEGGVRWSDCCRCCHCHTQSLRHLRRDCQYFLQYLCYFFGILHNQQVYFISSESNNTRGAVFEAEEDKASKSSALIIQKSLVNGYQWRQGLRMKLL